MGAGQIGGIATLLDIDFENAAGFEGVPAKVTEAQFMVYYMSQAMMFCAGVLIEADVILTPATCVYSERHRFQVFAGSHKFLENAGTARVVQDICVHKGYNNSKRWEECSSDNLALLILGKHYSLHHREVGSQFSIQRARYGVPHDLSLQEAEISCHYYGWGSRRNGYLIPLLINMHRVDVNLLPASRCVELWNYDSKYLCLQQPPCKSETHGALCPDDMGSALICSGYIYGMMTSRAIDRPCGTGFLDLRPYTKFLTCGVDDTRDVVDLDNFLLSYDYTSKIVTPSVITAPQNVTATDF